MPPPPQTVICRRLFWGGPGRADTLIPRFEPDLPIGLGDTVFLYANDSTYDDWTHQVTIGRARVLDSRRTAFLAHRHSTTREDEPPWFFLIVHRDNARISAWTYVKYVARRTKGFLGKIACCHVASKDVDLPSDTAQPPPPPPPPSNHSSPSFPPSDTSSVMSDTTFAPDSYSICSSTSTDKISVIVYGSALASAPRIMSDLERTRTSIHLTRASLETISASLETTRAGTESTRASAESTRASTESTRASAESTRASTESTRASTERPASSGGRPAPPRELPLAVFDRFLSNLERVESGASRLGLITVTESTQILDAAVEEVEREAREQATQEDDGQGKYGADEE